MSKARRALEEGASVNEVFAAEARERVDAARGILERGFPAPGSREMDELYRHAHALKGTAGSLGFPRVAALAGDLATRLKPLERDAAVVDEGDASRVESGYAALADAVRELESGTGPR
jgi:chemotaxis protein histidine kinase CheA